MPLAMFARRAEALGVEHADGDDLRPGGEAGEAEVVAGPLGDRAGHVSSVPVLVERHPVLVDEVVAGQELLASRSPGCGGTRASGPVRDAGVENRHPRTLAGGDAALLEDLPGPRGVEPAALLELERGGGLAAERPARQEVPLRPLPAPGDTGGAGVIGDGRGVGDVVGHRVGHRRVGVEGPLGGGDADVRGELQDLLIAAVEAHEQLARARTPAARACRRPRPAPPQRTRAIVTRQVVAISFRMVPGESSREEAGRAPAG